MHVVDGTFYTKTNITKMWFPFLHHESVHVFLPSGQPGCVLYLVSHLSFCCYRDTIIYATSELLLFTGAWRPVGDKKSLFKSQTTVNCPESTISSSVKEAPHSWIETLFPWCHFQVLSFIVMVLCFIRE